MEHQTLIAYGGEFEDHPEFGFDDLLLHEVAHEWWGNSVTAADWADFWIHEGFATYAEALYVLDTQGEARYLEYMKEKERDNENREPIVAGRDRIAHEAYVGDIYSKGAGVLHSLRWLIGDEPFFAALHRFASQPPYAYGLVSTADFEALVAEVAGRPLPWFFERYLRHADLPVWRLERRPAGAGRERVTLSWDDAAFEMPLPVAVGGEIRRLEMPRGRGELEVAAGAEVAVDPEGRLLDREAVAR
jgi:aminopeptidase N